MPPAALALEQMAARLERLVRRELEVEVEPYTLFDVPLDDEAAIAVEVERLTRLLRPAAPEAPPAPSASASAGPAPRPAPPQPSASASAPAPAPAADPPEAERGAELGPPPDPRWLEARLAVDRARLAFYRLPKAAREALLVAHAERREADGASKAKREILEADRRAKAAEESRQRALEEARRARSEAARAIAEEQARLSQIEREHAELEADLMRRRERLGGVREETLGWQRRIREAIERAAAGAAGGPSMDALYDELRATLRAARADLDATLSALSVADAGVPAVGADPLEGLGLDLDTTAVRAQRAAVQEHEQALVLLVREVQKTTSEVLLDRIEKLNAARIALIPSLSTGKRDAVRGLGTTGRDQATAELWQVSLVLRAHLVAGRNYWATLERSADARRAAAWSTAGLLARILAPVLLLAWWRRSAPQLLEGAIARRKDALRRRGELGEDLGSQALSVLASVRGTLELGILLLALRWALPAATQQLLEVRLLFTVLGWAVGGALVVRVVDAIAERSDGPGARATKMQTSHLRGRSLRLVGRAVALGGSVLALTRGFVGEGTVHHWAVLGGAAAAAPILLVIGRWWRPVVFELASRQSRRSAFLRVIAGGRGSRVSALYATVGGAALLASGLWRRLRAFTTDFELTRRALAYLFRREMLRKGKHVQARPLAPLPVETAARLGPEHPSAKVIKTAVDDEVEALLSRLQADEGGVFAVVGERGQGKTTLLGRAREELGERALHVQGASLDALREALARELGLAEGSDEGALVSALESAERGVLVGDAHRLIRPTMGGLLEIDRTLALARRTSERAAWVLALDQVVWRFFELARGARPPFDEVIHLRRWPEEAVGNLLRARCKEADVAPRWDRVMDELPEDAGELEVEQARASVEAAYHRMLWDHAEGNPGVALEAFRSCLGVTEDGEVAVDPFHPVDIRALESLPDPALFVLRAVVRLESSNAREVAGATMLPRAAVEDALRYAAALGVLERRGDAYHVTWAWHRTLTRLLRRRYLLQPARSAT